MSATLTLYELAGRLAEIEQALIDAGGELTPEIEAALEAAEGAFDEKAERVALKARELKATAEVVASEARRLQDRAATLTRAATSLVEYLHRQMTTVGRAQIKRPLVSIAIQASPPSARCEWPEAELYQYASDPVTAPYVRLIPATYRFDAKAAIEAWRRGETLPSGITVTQGTHVRIR